MMNRLNPNDVKVELDKMRTGLHLPSFKSHSSLTEILDGLSDPIKLKAMSPIELVENAVVLAKYSLDIAIEEGRIKSFMNWCEANIKHLLGQNLHDMPTFCYGFNEKDCYFRARNENAQNLDKDRLVAQAKLDQLLFLAQKVQYIAGMLKNLADEKNRYLKAP
jgi:hypothetical protein